MIVEANLEFLDPFKNCYTETIEVFVEQEDNVEAIVEDEITSWFFRTAAELFRKAHPEYNQNDNEWLEKFGFYLKDSKMWGDIA